MYLIYIYSLERRLWINSPLKIVPNRELFEEQAEPGVLKVGPLY